MTGEAFESLAQEFHRTYEEKASLIHGENWRKIEWERTNKTFRQLLTETIADMIERGVIRIGKSPG